MLKSNLIHKSKLLTKKLVIIAAIFGIAKPVAIEANFFGDLFGSISSAASTIYDGAAKTFNAIDQTRKTAGKIIKTVKIAGLCLALFLGYKAIFRPVANTFFGAKGKTITYIADNGVKWSVIAAGIVIPVVIIIWLINNQKKLVAQISDLKKHMTTKLEETENKLSGQMGELAVETKNNHDTAMNEISSVKQSSKNTEAITKKIFGLLTGSNVKLKVKLNPAQLDQENNGEDDSE